MNNLLTKIFPYLSTIMGIFLICSFFILFYDFSKPLPNPIQIIYQTESASPIEASSLPKESLTVSISGAVNSPGEYQMNPGSIIYDAIQSAGGLTDIANLALSDLNTSSLIYDNLNIFIPSDNDQTKSAVPAFIDNSYSNSDLIDINTASKSELTELSGVGDSTAQKIIDYRSSNPFDTIEEIMEIKGIGEKSFEKIKNSISI